MFREQVDAVNILLPDSVAHPDEVEEAGKDPGGLRENGWLEPGGDGDGADCWQV